MSMGSRIKEARLNRRLTQEELAAIIGVTKGAIANYENGVSSPKIELLYKLFDALQCDANYLYQDEMADIDNFQASFAEQSTIRKLRALDEHGKRIIQLILDQECDRVQAIARQELILSSPKVIKMPVYNDPAAAGIPLYAESEYEFMDFPDEEIPRGADFGVRIMGDSMEPTIQDGQIAWIKRTPEVRDGQIGVFMLDGGEAVCKRAQCRKDGRIQSLISDNEDYESITGAALRDMRIVGTVLL